MASQIEADGEEENGETLLLIDRLPPVEESYELDLQQEQRNGAEHRLIVHLQVNNLIGIDSGEDDRAMARNEHTNRSMITQRSTLEATEKDVTVDPGSLSEVLLLLQIVTMSQFQTPVSTLYQFFHFQFHSNAPKTPL